MTGRPVDSLSTDTAGTLAETPAERRIGLLYDLNTRLAEARTADAVATAVIEAIASDTFDLPFALTYALDLDAGVYRLAGQTGCEAQTAPLPTVLSLDAAAPWPVKDIVATRDPVLIDLAANDQPPSRAFGVPIRAPGAAPPVALLILGLNPRLALDEACRSFCGLLAATVSASLREQGLRAEIAAARDRAALRQTEQQLAFALQAGRMGSWELDVATGAITSSASCRTVFGVGADDPFEHNDDIIALVHPDDRGPRQRAINRAVAARADLETEFRIIRPDGRIGWVLTRGQARYEGRRAVRFAGVSLDITARKNAEEHQRLLLDELNHRVKNTLATVQSLAMQTRQTIVHPSLFDDTFLARILALAGAHELLTEASWEGASLAEVIHRTLKVHAPAGQAARVRFSGPTIRLGPNAAVTMNMAFHELATNAVKYGALSTDEGRVDVEWSVVKTEVERPVLALDWRESGGPAVAAPTRRGFGSRLIEQGLARELEGECKLVFAADGLSCHLRLPLSAKLSLAA